MCDLEAMFYQVMVNVNDRNFLRFLWWKDGDLDNEPIVYRMTAHLFGATSSRDALPIERALGVQWCVESDTFKFRIELADRPLTRRAGPYTAGGGGGGGQQGQLPPPKKIKLAIFMLL
jgi:hypothetical protein